MNLSKSKYCSGVQCPKMLWMARNKPEEYDESVLDQSVLDTGNRVGDVAMGFFGAFTEVPYSEDKLLMLKETKRLMDLKTPVITEASFAYEGNFCSVDILRLNNGAFDIIEVKSSTGIKDVYLHDMAYQYYVLSKCGVKIGRIYLIHINGEYVRSGKLDLAGLFKITDCIEKVIPYAQAVERNIAHIKKIAQSETEPSISWGTHCFDPYKCGFRGYCWREVPKPSVFDISGLRLSKKFELAANGTITFDDLLKNILCKAFSVKLNENQLRQVAVHAKALPPQIDKLAIKAFLARVSYPLYFLDFETYQQAIPEYDGVSPYMQIPFQFSLHRLEQPGGVLSHHEFLFTAGGDPRRELADQLCRFIPKNVCVLAYNMGFEKGVIKKLAASYSDLAEHLINIHDNIRDLMEPFKKQAYYCREMEGSYSIKRVLPVLCPNDPDLNYGSLDGIHNGSEAMAAFAGISERTPEQAEQIRRNLFAYCRLDTLAMVKILEKLVEAAG